ncbi:DUF2809 domain-containing protein [Aequorivita sp. H23M31]|uniref:DUF2809 domain-containing protein n=1 Tax=Aequorivita ciconiae TaxID=2494375 RepID=A0A410FZB6_9FLAO|nr:DUF2809 domain-containing protein [Aequorivita sp. H23M31]QAA80326.1 DUF2809 domain-containing protein [Aequorivita sp. H23M31]
MFTFKRNYFLLTILFFLIEVFIALFVNDNFVRPYIGDVLVVILIYCFLRTFLKISVLKTALFVLLFSFTVEVLQLMNLIERLQLQESKITQIVLGTSFSWIDMLCYIIGILMVIAAESLNKKEIISNI